MPLDRREQRPAILIRSGWSGSANADVNYAALPNTCYSPRTGTITVAGQTFTVTQAGLVHLTTDQRGYLRYSPLDVGAVEVNGLRLAFTNIFRMGNDIHLTFNATAGQTFRVERASSLPPGRWDLVGDVRPVATGSATVIDSGAVTLGRGFYRVRLLP